MCEQFLFKCRTTPQTTTGVCPTELLMGRKLRTHVDLHIPDIGKRETELAETFS